MDDILLFQILPRLPARSVGRFMSVCKQWHSFLTTPMFTKMHLHHVNDKNHLKLLAISATNPCKYFSTIDCETPEVGLSAAKKRSLPFEIHNNEMWIISSLNGLVCVGINRSMMSASASVYDYSDIILWNPLMGEYKMLSKGICSRIYVRGYGLYYSCCDDDYKLLCVTKSGDGYIYSWKYNSWRKAMSRVGSLMNFWYSSCLLNGKLYFVAHEYELSSLIIRFDTKTEMFTEIATPFSKCFNLIVARGCIHLCVLPEIDLAKVEFWNIDGDGEWTTVKRYFPFPILYIPCHQMKNGNWLMHSSSEVSVYKVDRKKAKEACKYTIDSTVQLLVNGKFVETIVSLKPK